MFQKPSSSSRNTAHSSFNDGLKIPSPKCRPVVSQMPPRRLPNASPLSPICSPVVSQMPARCLLNAVPSSPKCRPAV